MLWLYVHFPALQLDDLFNNYPEKQSVPVVIVDQQTNQVLQLNLVAAQEGIKIGMGIGAASALADNLLLLPFDETLEATLLDSYAQSLYQFTADIALYPSKGLLLNAGRMLRLHGNLAHYWQLLQQRISQFNVTYHAACGHTANIAKVLATSGVTLISEVKEQQNGALVSLPLSALMFHQTITQNLTRIGIKSIGDLLQLPLPELARRFDSTVVNFIAELTGKIPSKIDWFTPSLTFTRRLTLLYDISTVSVLSKPVYRLLNALEQYLIKHDSSAYQITFCFFTRDNDKISLTVHSAQAIHRASEWLTLFELKASQLVLRSPIIIIEMYLQEVVKNLGEMNDLYQGKRGRLSFQQLASLLLNKLGSQSVFHLRMGNSHAPERASLYQPVTYQVAAYRQKRHDRAIATTEKRIISKKTTQRPSFLLVKPERVCASISIYYGPERIQTAWWQEKAINRDYFIGRNASGQWCWVYRQADSQWFIHGYFA